MDFMTQIERGALVLPEVAEEFNSNARALEATPPASECFAAPEDWGVGESIRHAARRAALKARRAALEAMLLRAAAQP